MKFILHHLFFLFLFLLAAAPILFSQNRPTTLEHKGLVYYRETAGDLRLHPKGWAFAMQFGKIKTFYKTSYYELGIGELRHPKEHRQNPDPAYGRAAKSFFFGKQNSFFAVRAGFGQKRYFSEKAAQRGLAVGLNYEVGATLGLLKPYYLRVLEPIDGGPPNKYRAVSEKYTDETAENFLNVGLIEGAASFSKGIDEISILPGGHARVGVHFDWGAFDEYLKAIEAGVMVDVFPKKVPIMVSEENTPVFVNLYISFQFGKRR